MLPSPGSKAPVFSLLDQDGKTFSLSDARGTWLLIYFYPKDDTPGCTTEACSIRDTWKDFSRSGIEVVGISADSVKSHAKFVEKYQLPFRVLADTEKEVVKLYGVWGPKKFMGREFLGIQRMSFLVNPDGVIAKVYEKVKPAEHAAEILQDKELLSS